MEKLEGTCFRCFRSHLKDGKPKYDYKLEEGISSERLGLSIIENENVMGVIDEIVEESSLTV